jgi:hypothetical protein
MWIEEATGFRERIQAGIICLNPNSEAGGGRHDKCWGASASGVGFSASRRKIRAPNFFPPGKLQLMWDISSGATPELARGTRAVPIPISGFGLKHHYARGLIGI